MKEFNDIQSLWQQQNTDASHNATELIEMAEQQKRRSIKKHRAGILTLSITSLVLITLWLITPFNNAVAYGLTIMISALITRIVLEVYSYMRMNKIDITEVASVYKKQISAFYKLRKQLVTWFTALAVIAYITGFAIMLPVFKQTLPTWFYWYIVIFLIIGIPLSAFFLIRQARNEIKDLKRVLSQLD
ncbi:MAG: hypothetical protein N4A74_02570 [Carboxylicivirga sp.]|jgi:hypothetical protein|nr:hypothetical protein [Carboxylicivirga sp.]